MAAKKPKPQHQRIGEAKGILDAMGQESEKEGIKWTQYFLNKFNKEEADKDQLTEEKLRKHRLTKKKYTKMLAHITWEKMMAFEKPSSGYSFKVLFSDKGVLVQFKDKFKRIWTKAFKPCGIPKIDYNATKVIAGMAEDKMYALDEGNGKTKSGIYLK